MNGGTCTPKKENLTSQTCRHAGPLARRGLSLSVPRQHFVIGRGGGHSSALDDGTREGGEPILLDDEALLGAPFI